MCFLATKTCPASSATEHKPLTVTVTRKGSVTTTVTETIGPTSILSSAVSKETDDVSDVETATVTSVSTHLVKVTATATGKSGRAKL